MKLVILLLKIPEMRQLISFLILFIPTFIFLVLFGQAFELYLDYFSQVSINFYNTPNGKPPTKLAILFSGFLYCSNVMICILNALPVNLLSLAFVRKRAVRNTFLHTLLMTLLLVILYYILHLFPSPFYDSKEAYELKLISLGIGSFLLLLCLLLLVKRRYRLIEKRPMQP